MERSVNEQKNKRRLYIAVAGCFITILIYEILTPMMSDDFYYRKIVQGAGSFFELFRQEYDHYMNHIGRSVGHIVMRFLMYPESLIPGKVVLAAVFTLMTWLMYRLTEGKRGVRQYMMGVLLLWIFGVAFSDTVLWLTGACNYMVTTTIILADMLFYERVCGGDKKCDRGTGTLSHFSKRGEKPMVSAEKCDSCTRPPVTLFARLLSSHI